MGLKELKLLAKIQNDFIVRYNTSWFENENTLFIQMEFCLDTLRNVLNKRLEAFQRKEKEMMGLTEYFISNELFKEILMGVNYIHKLEPPIIHRDLKPQNILITTGINGKFIKIGDFGLSTFHYSENHSHTKVLGTLRYMAPEIKEGKDYNTKSDIYSLGVVAQELFEVYFDSYVFIRIS